MDQQSIRRIATDLHINPSTVYRVIKRFMTYGVLLAKDEPNREEKPYYKRHRIRGSTLAHLHRILQDDPRLYLDEMQAELFYFSGEEFTIKMIIGALKRLG